jgi:hypothetical protein
VTVDAVLRAHRHAIPCHAIEPAAEVRESHDRNETGSSRPTSVQGISTRVSVGRPAPPEPRSADIGEGELACRCTRPKQEFRRCKGDAQGDARGMDSRILLCVSEPVEASNPLWVLLGARVRHIFNADTGTFNGSGSRLRIIGIPINIGSDFGVLGQGEKESSDEKALAGVALVRLTG